MGGFYNMKKIFVCLTVCLLFFSLMLTYMLIINDGKSERSNSLSEEKSEFDNNIGIFDIFDVGENDEIKKLSVEEKKYDDFSMNNQLISAKTAQTGVFTKINSNDSGIEKYTVVFKDFDDTVIDTQTVERGGSAKSPANPTRDGYLFLGWDKSFSYVTSNLTVIAQYDNENTSSIILNDVSAQKGQKDVEVIVSVKKNPGILGMILSLTYDESAMTLKGVANGEAVNDVLTLTKAKVLNSGCNFVWDGESITSEEIKDGTILVLKFDILDTAKVGKYDISVSYEDGNIIDGDLNPVSVSIKSGSVTVSE